MSFRRLPGPWCAEGINVAPIVDLRWLVLDVETTGLDPARHMTTEFAAFVVDGDGVRPAGLGLEEGLDVAADVARSGAVVVAHNLAFDLAFLAEDRRAPVELSEPSRWMCTYRAGDRPSSLDALAAVFGIALTGRHTAEGDARALAEVVRKLIVVAGKSVGATVADMIAPLRSGSIGIGEHARPTLELLRTSLDRVVPVRLPSREQRRAFAQVAASAERSETLPADHDHMVAILRDAGITGSAFELLVAERDTSTDT